MYYRTLILVFFLPLLWASSLCAKNPKAKIKKPLVNFELNNLFSVSENPGKGTLLFSIGESGRELKLGAETGYYGYGLVFRSKALPKKHRKEFKGKNIVQIAFGILKDKAGDFIPQFGMLSLLSKGMPSGKVKYVVAGRGSRSLASNHKPSALMLFSSPWLSRNASEKEKLENTWFGSKGALTVVSVSKPQQSSGSFQDKQVNFKAQLVEIKMDVKLSTPFNYGRQAAVEGNVVIPIYWPANEAAQQLTDELANLSLDDSK